MVRDIRRRRTPLYDDVDYGWGGKAAGRFDDGHDTLLPVNSNYVEPGYIEGQGGYILGDLGDGPDS